MLLDGMELQPGAYPVKAVDFLVRAKLPGPIWNGGNYAGYLIGGYRLKNTRSSPTTATTFSAALLSARNIAW